MKILIFNGSSAYLINVNAPNTDVIYIPKGKKDQIEVEIKSSVRIIEK